MTRENMGIEVVVTNRQRRLRIDTRRLAGIAGRALGVVGAKPFHLGIALVNDAAIAKLNSQYHQTSGPTDILSFDYGEGQGELIISVERAVAQARRYGTTTARELVLYVVHGILHLRGYDDLTAPERRRMRAAERKLMMRVRKGFAWSRLVAQ
ncbi:MAG TPA: rRNA maturation RNase YbeY [Verrucomicrobiae bacterium]|nr:rRNA maturation RNase YbeY [Verrucomicrobiae bacterium]